MLDADATVEKACCLLAEAAGEGAELAVLPETFVSLYPSNAWAGESRRVQRQRRAVGAPVDQRGRGPRPVRRRATAACAEHGFLCVIGDNELEAERPGDALQHDGGERPAAGGCTATAS